MSVISISIYLIYILDLICVPVTTSSVLKTKHQLVHKNKSQEFLDVKPLFGNFDSMKIIRVNLRTDKAV